MEDKKEEKPEEEFKIVMDNSLEAYLKWKKYKKDHEPKIGKSEITYGLLFD